MKRDEIVRSCDWHSKQTATLRKCVTKYKHCTNEWSKIIEALKLLDLTRFASPNQLIYFNFCTVLGVRFDFDIFRVTSLA